MGKRTWDFRRYAVHALLVVLTVAAFWQVCTFDYVDFDDAVYVADNRAIATGINRATLAWAFTTPYQANYHPITWVSLLIDGELSKTASFFFDVEEVDPRVFHCTNLVLHIASVLLLFAILNRLTGFKWRSAFVAALFAIHPLHVESVVWIAERKDVLSTFFWMATTWAYANYVGKPTARQYGILVILFILGLLSKPMLVSLPIMLLLMDIWPLKRLTFDGEGNSWKRIRVLVNEKAALLVLSVVSCGVTFWAQRAGGAVATLDAYPIGVRIANAFVTTMAYLVKMVWPRDLSILYRHRIDAIPEWQVFLSVVAVVLITTVALLSLRKRPYLTVGWLWYLITLVPVIGLVQVGYQSMADRYTYVPFIGIFFMIAWGVPNLLAGGYEAPVRRGAVALGVLATAVILALTVRCHQQVSYWRDGVSLFRHAVSLDAVNPYAHFNLGISLQRKLRTEEAKRHFREAIRLKPDYVDARINLADALSVDGDFEAAKREATAALRDDPDNVVAMNCLGSVFARQGMFDEAIFHFKKALKISPRDVRTMENLAKAEAALEAGL